MDAQGWLWEHLGALKGLLGSYGTTLGTVWVTFWHNFGVLEATFGQHFKKKLQLHDFNTPLQYNKGLGLQVGAVWAPRRCPEAVLTTKMAADRASREVRTAKRR